MESTPSSAPVKPRQTSVENVSGENLDSAARTLGNFRIVRLLGRGGMGEVYLAEQTSLKRNVALKLLRPDLAADEQYIQRFKAEAMAVAKIMHPNIVSVFEIGEQDGVHFIAFEYVQGTNLRDFLQKKGTLDLPTFLSIVSKVGAALERAGDEGIVHRDIKPENILLTKKGEVKVADFGLARQLGHDRVELTQSGMTMGTPLYMSPEQVEGKPVDQRSDLYSLGVMAYHMLAGEPPFRGATAIAIAIQHLNTKPVDLAILRAEVPTDYIAVIDKLMAKNVADRYQSARDLLRDLNRLRNQQPIEPGFAVSSDETAIRAESAPLAPSGTTIALRSTITQFLGIVGRRRYRPWLVAASLVCGLALGAGIGWLRREPALPVLSGTSHSAFAVPSTAGVVQQNNSALQLLHAVNVLPEEQVEAGLWAVIEHFAGAEIETIDAATRLFERYLKRRQYELALTVADRMANRENLAQKMVGGLFQGIVESRQGNASKSNQSLLEVFEKGKTQSRDVFLANERLDWLFRQYVLAIRVNFERLAKPLDESMIEDFWNAFKPLAAKRK